MTAEDATDVIRFEVLSRMAFAFAQMGQTRRSMVSADLFDVCHSFFYLFAHLQQFKFGGFLEL
jgi:hypothetical protein